MREVPLYIEWPGSLHLTRSTLGLATSVPRPTLLRTRHTLEPLAWHWSQLPGRLVNRGGKWHFSEGSNQVLCGATPQKALRGVIPCSFLEPLGRSWSHCVGIYRQK